MKDVRTLLLRSYPDFDFFAFDTNMQKANKTRVRKMSDQVKDKSEDFQEESISDDEPEAVSSDDERFIPNRVPQESEDS